MLVHAVVVREALDEAWAAHETSFLLDPLEGAQARQRMAEAIISLAHNGERDIEVLSRAGEWAIF